MTMKGAMRNYARFEPQLVSEGVFRRSLGDSASEESLGSPMEFKSSFQEKGQYQHCNLETICILLGQFAFCRKSFLLYT